MGRVMLNATRQKGAIMKIELSEKSVDVIYAALEKAQPKPNDLYGKPVLSITDMVIYTQCRNLIAEIKDQDPRWQRIQ